jgi:RNA polymerase sigma-70 factor (ECF subfamily)
MRIALKVAVDELPEQNRVAFVLVDVLGFSREDAAAMVDVPGNTMRARVARARMLLADALTDTGETER